MAQESAYETAARDAGLTDRFGDGWEVVCKRHNIKVEKPIALEIRKESESRWQLYHMPTGLAIPHTNLLSYGKNKKKDVKALMDFIAPKFPWHEWTSADIEHRPQWGAEAVQCVREYLAPFGHYANNHCKGVY